MGLFLALSLARAGIPFRVYESRTEIRRESRSIGIHPPSLELLASLDLVDRFVANGVQVERAEVHGEGGKIGAMSFGACRPPFRFVLTLPQMLTELFLREALEARVPGAIETAHVKSVSEARAAGVRVDLVNDRGAKEEREHPIVVACDGKRSAVRESLGVAFEGRTYPGRYAMADFRDTTSLGSAAAIYLGKEGLLESFPLPAGFRRWVVRCTDAEDAGTRCVVERVKERAGIDLEEENAEYASTFRANRFLANRFSVGRVAFAGDAAHEISPIGGQGMNLGWIGAAMLAKTIAASRESENPTRALAADAAERRRHAVVAARRAELNMWLGRPVGGTRIRDAVLAQILDSPARHVLARSVTMRGLHGGI